MSDEKSPDTIEVVSGDIIRSGPIERGVSASTDAERAELYKHMAFEADKEVKRLQRELEVSRAARRAVEDQAKEVKALARKADDVLAIVARVVGEQCYTLPSPMGYVTRDIAEARAALTKALEGWE